MLTTQVVLTRDILVALAIALLVSLAGLVFYFGIRRLARRMAEKTGTALDNMLIEALEWPVFAGMVLTGIYFALLSLPWKEPFEFQIKRGFYVAFIILAGVGGRAVVDCLFRWFKLEVASKTRIALNDWINGLLRGLIPFVAGLLAVLAILGQFGVETRGVTDWLLVHGTRIGIILILSIVAVFVLGLAVPRAINAFVARGMPGQPEEEVEKRAKTLTAVLVTTGEVFVLLIAAFIILSELDIDIAPIMAGVGVVGIAIGFGAQSLVKDLIAGLFIVMENQYRVGDVVKVADVSGLVEEINLRRTVLRDMDGIVHVVPNGEIRVASNLTKEWSRVNLNISVSYGTDLDRAIVVINRVCNEMARESAWAPLILRTPQVLRVDKLGDSGIEIKVLGETKPIRQWDVTGEIRKRIKKAFDEEGIEIPWPHTKVFFGNSPTPTTAEEKKEG